MLGVPFGVLLLSFLPWLLPLGGGFYLALRAVRALERRSSALADVRAFEERLRRM